MVKYKSNLKHYCVHCGQFECQMYGDLIEHQGNCVEAQKYKEQWQKEFQK